MFSLKVIGVTGADRQSHMPDVPTLAESGAPGYEYVGWTGFLAPSRTAPAIVAKLSADMAKIAKATDLKKTLGDDIEVIGSSPEYFRKHIVSEFNLWQKIIREAGIKLQD